MMRSGQRLNWDRLRVFEAVAKAGSISGAISGLSITQSAASRQIKGLEESLRFDLFYRTSRGMRLTEQGEVLYRTVASFKGELEDTQDLFFNDAKEATGSLVITTSVDLGSTWLAPKLTSFCRQYPGLELKVLLSEEPLALHERAADVAIRFGRSDHLEMHNRFLMTLEWGLYAHRDYLEGSDKIAQPGDLRGHRIISFGDRLPQPSRQVLWHDELAREHGCPEDNIVCINNLSGMYEMALNGGGVVMLPHYMVDSMSPLLPVLKEMETPALDVYMIYPDNLRKSKRVLVLFEYLWAEANPFCVD